MNRREIAIVGRLDTGGIINVSEFCKITGDAFNEYLSAIASLTEAGQLSTTITDPVPSFPQMIIVTTLPNHFAYELVGGRRINRKLKVVKRDLGDSGLYFGQFNYPAETKVGIKISGPADIAAILENPRTGMATGGGIGSMALITLDAREELDRRFPAVVDQHLTKITIVGEDVGPPFVFSEDAGFFHIDDVLLANALNGMVRIRHIRHASIIPKDASREDYRRYLDKLLDIRDGLSPVAMQFLPGHRAETIHHAAQFANIFLMNRLHETSIGSFIDQHSEVLLSALEAKQLISEPYLEWVIPSPDPSEHAVNPDLFVQRSDGYWDVYDLKLALLNRKDITTGRRNRRRFVASIEEGIAQLAHYRDFLSIPEHAALAKEKYGVTFDDPRFVLVVGNYENVDTERVADARRRFAGLELIDYDSLLQLYLIHKNALPDYSGGSGPNTKVTGQPSRA